MPHAWTALLHAAALGRLMAALAGGGWVRAKQAADKPSANNRSLRSFGEHTRRRKRKELSGCPTRREFSACSHERSKALEQRAQDADVFCVYKRFVRQYTRKENVYVIQRQRMLSGFSQLQTFDKFQVVLSALVVTLYDYGAYYGCCVPLKNSVCAL